MTKKIGTRAVVIGASIGGLCAARALSETFEQVVVVERDHAPTPDSPRAGAPQGRHPHMLLAGGLAAMVDLCPGLPGELERSGARRVHAGRDIGIETSNWGLIPPRDINIVSYAGTRPALETAIYRAMLRGRNIEVRHQGRATEILLSADRGHVVGMSYQDAEGAPHTLSASLVVNASGDGRLSDQCLEACGLELPPTVVIGVDVGYTTGVFHLPADLPLETLITFARPPERPRNGMMMRTGDTEWQVLVAGRGRDQPPGDLEGFLAFAHTLNTPTIADLISRGVAPDSLVRYRFPASVWRRYGTQGRLPDGLLPLGDAVCRFNPVYGQGMSVAALEARILADELRRHSGSPATLALAGPAYLARTDELVGEAWALSTAGDFSFSTTTGVPPADLSELRAGQAAAMEGAVHSLEGHRALLERLTLLTASQRMTADALAGA